MTDSLRIPTILAQIRHRMGEMTDGDDACVAVAETQLRAADPDGNAMVSLHDARRALIMPPDCAGTADKIAGLKVRGGEHHGRRITPETNEYIEPTRFAPPLFDDFTLAGNLEAMPFNPGNPQYAKDGRLFVSVQSAGFDVHNDRAGAQSHIWWRRPGGELQPMPAARGLGGVLGIKVIPKPDYFGGPRAGELLIAVDWKKSEFIAYDINTIEGGEPVEVFRYRLPGDTFPPGLNSFHNDVTVSFEDNPDGTFFTADEADDAIGVFEPNWRDPDVSRYTKVLDDHPTTRHDDTIIAVNWETVKLRPHIVLRRLGLKLRIPFVGGDFQNGVDSIGTYTAVDRDGVAKEFLLYSVLAKKPAELVRVPVELLRFALDSADLEGEALAALAAERGITELRPEVIGQIPETDGHMVKVIDGQPYLFAANHQAQAIYVRNLSTGAEAPMVRLPPSDDPRDNVWLDGVTLFESDDGRMTLTSASSALNQTLAGQEPAKHTQGVLSYTFDPQELVRRLKRRVPF